MEESPWLCRLSSWVKDVTYLSCLKNAGGQEFLLIYQQSYQGLEILQFSKLKVLYVFERSPLEWEKN